MEERGTFYNDGSGWTCRPCERDLAAKKGRSKRPAKSSAAKQKTDARAKWTDATERFLTCPRCGLTEPFDLS